jgi:hypothetical protein
MNLIEPAVAPSLQVRTIRMPRTETVSAFTLRIGVLMAILPFLGCATAPPKWGYRATKLPKIAAVHNSISICVLQPEEGRIGVTDEEQAKGPGTYLPVPERLAFGTALYQQLKESAPGSHIHWAPLFQEHYDFAVRSRVLGPLVGGVDYRGAFVIDVAVESGLGREIASRRFDFSYFTGPLKAGMGLAMRQMTPWICETISKQAESKNPLSERSRARRYYESLDPEVGKFREEIEKRAAEGSRNGNPIPASLARAYVLKTAILESLRLTEWNSEATHQKTKLEHAAKVFQSIHTANEKIAQQQNERIAAVLLAGGMATVSAGMAADPNIQNSPGTVQTWTQLSVTMQAVAVQALDSQTAALYEAQLHEQVLSQDKAVLETFRDIRGTLREVRGKWMERYHQQTPSLSDVVSLRWPPRTEP